MEETKKVSIAGKWRKYIWVGIVALIGTIKWLASETTRLQNELKDCNMSQINALEARRIADSVMIYKYMDNALRKSTEEIIQPKLDSLNAHQ